MVVNKPHAYNLATPIPTPQKQQLSSRSAQNSVLIHSEELGSKRHGALPCEHARQGPQNPAGAKGIVGRVCCFQSK